ncbi:unnamed protein product [Bursaphelenchus xylophilus]|uniref:(pine wood nematode) hypothetical protein n=1 Tax=Bursaphelenchus xylophilus TaxID=6326 RepID=A0A1I7RXJ9_BURXY|nr:unnamed protein product [Bursaphelenchus xylophilus]CAG9126498.1 unnamed protein product [Bursaphelenchus xylophilus]
MKALTAVFVWLFLAITVSYARNVAAFGARGAFGDMGEPMVVDGLSGFGDTGREGRMFVMQDTRADPRCVFCRGGSFRKRFAQF